MNPRSWHLRSPRLPPGIKAGGTAVIAVLLFIGMFTFPEAPDTTLDPSWRIALSHAFYHGFQFGRDVVFTYGPFGFLMGNTYDGTHFWGLVAWQLIKGIAFTKIILHAGENLPLAARWSFFAVFLLFGFYFEDTLHLNIIFILGLWSFEKIEPPKAGILALMGAGLAWLSAIKFTNLLLASSAVTIATLLHLQQSRRRDAVALSLGYILGYLLFWIMAGQSLGYLPDYFINAWQICRGYEESMGLPPPGPALFKALAVIALLSAGLGWQFAHSDRGSRAVAKILLIGAFGFISWKHGFVRADGHMGGFFIAMLPLLILVPTFFPENGEFKAAIWGVTTLTALLCIESLDDTFTITRSNAWDIFQSKISDHATHLAHWKNFRQNYETQLRERLAALPLDKTRKLVGDASIDVLGYEGGIICLHRMNYRPRPVFQSYSVYNSALERLNYNYFVSPHAPTFLLQKMQTIDERLLVLDDAVILRHLPRFYEFLLAEDGYLLWRRRSVPEPEPAAPAAVVLEGMHATGEPLSLERFSGRRLWLELDQPLSWLGRVRAIFYQPPIVYLQLTDAAGYSSRHRLPLSQARAGFILSPIIEDAADYLSYCGGEPRRRLQRLALEIQSGDRRFFSGQFHFTVTEIPPQPFGKPAAGEIRRARFHMFKTPPVAEKSFVPLAESEIDGHPTMVVHAPGEMRFDLPPHASSVTGSFGFPAGAYSDGGRTEGAVFEVSWTDGQKRAVLFSRQLDPLHQPADRGLHSFSVELTHLSRGQLLLDTMPGPSGNNSWGWTAWSDVEIHETHPDDR